MAREFGLGYLKPPPDGRNNNFLAANMRSQVVEAIGKPKPRKQPYKEGPILDQGQVPECVGYSGKGFLNAAPIMTSPTAEPSGHQIYVWAQDNDEWPGNNYDGSSIKGGNEGLKKAGHIKGYAWAKTLDQVIEWINGGYGTAWVGTYWYPHMDNVDKNGFMLEPSSFSTPVGGHAYRLNWFDVKKQGFLQINTWGHAWGMPLRDGTLSGTAYVSRKLAQRLLFDEEGEVSLPTQVKLVPVKV